MPSSTWAGWSARQPTTRDDGAGVYTPGMRVDVQRLLELDFLPADLRLALVEGHRYRWSQCPTIGHARCHKPNYRSCEDNIEHAAPEFDRLIEPGPGPDLGLVEGPLDYVPWVVPAIPQHFFSQPSFPTSLPPTWPDLLGMTRCSCRRDCG